MTFSAYIQLQKSRIMRETGTDCAARGAVAHAKSGAAAANNAKIMCGATAPAEEIRRANYFSRSPYARSYSGMLSDRERVAAQADADRLLCEIDALVGLNTREREFYAALRRARGARDIARSAS